MTMKVVSIDIKNISVIGLGTIGRGIALLCAEADLNVNVYDKSDLIMNKGFENIKLRLNNIKVVKTLEEACRNVDLIIECIDENIELKQAIFKELDELCSLNVILASCTSGLLPTVISKNTKHQERVVVAHFWNPPGLIPLVEVVPGERTSKDTIFRTTEWIEYIGNKAIIMKKECPGFIGNRLQHALLREALYIVEQGFAEPFEVDKVIEFGLGRRLPVTGPICSADFAGLDVVNSISQYLYKDLCNSIEPSDLMEKKVQSGELGSKSGKGFYNWDPEILKQKQKERAEILLYFLERDNKKKDVYYRD